jgi:rSAM/selenodomain-associated transferase 1
VSARLYIAAKAPRPGVAKTRLGRVVGQEAAVALYRAFLHDLAAHLVGAGLPIAWYVTPPDAWRELAPHLPPPARKWPVIAQGDGDWADRQRALFHMAAECHERVVLIASDSPQVGADDVGQAFALLERHDLVLGPVHDGGYWLIGMRARRNTDRDMDVFAGVTMSTGDVLAQILARADALGLSAALLPPTFDIDEAADLDHLRDELSRRRDMAATRAALARWESAQLMAGAAR